MNNQAQSDVTTWPQLAEGLYSFLTGRGATIEYEVEDLNLQVPRDTSENSPRAHWTVSGKIRIRTQERSA